MVLPDFESLDVAVQHVRRQFSPRPEIGVVLGSGLGVLADELEERGVLPYAALPGMPRAAVVGHAGNLCLGKLAGRSVACLQGRVHAYEGHAPADVVFGVCLLARLGCRAVLVTNAAGGIDASFVPGDLMLITDHLNLTGNNPLLGPVANGCERFPDMSAAYDPELRAAAQRAAAKLGKSLQHGVYAGLLGPTYETPAEIRMLRTLGASAVGMSTVWEVIALRQLGIRVGAMSCITNLAAGISAQPLSHAEVQATADRVSEDFVAVMRAWIAELP